MNGSEGAARAETYGPHMGGPAGWIVEDGGDAYRHRFGGESWRTASALSLCPRPTLLLTLDLNDPRLAPLKAPGLEELPLCYSIDCDLLLRRQTFRLQPATRTVTLIKLDADSPEPFDDDDALPNPLPEKRVRLRAMVREDYPTDEDSYWSACDEFVGGEKFIRVLGPPLWLQDVEHVPCDCGSPMEYVCSFGYEGDGDPGGFVPDGPFFIGEAALYFFLCRACLKTAVTSQST